MSKRPFEFGCAECPSLGKVFKLDTLNDHYRTCHVGLKVNRCGICLSPFDHRTSLIRHIKTDHENKEESSINDVADNNIYNVAATSNSEEETDDVDISHSSMHEDCETINSEKLIQKEEEKVDESNPYPLLDLSSVAGEIIMELRSTARLTHAAIERFQESHQKLLDAHTSTVKHKLFSSLQARGMSKSDIVGLLDEVYKIEDPFLELKTIDSQLEFYKQKYGLVKPQEFFLDTRIDNRLDPRTNEYVPTQVNESFEYVPIVETLKLILSLKHNFDSIFQDFSSKDEFLRSFADGTDFQNHPLLKKYGKNVILICLFYDDLEIAAALGSKTIIHKLGVFFFQILNGPPHVKSKLSSIHLLALVHADDLKKPGAFQKVLYKFIQDMKSLGSDNGVEIEIDGKPFTLRAVLATVTADTLAAHELLGFLSPAAKHFCRVCTIDRPAFRLDGNLEAPLRTPLIHDQQVEEVKRHPTLSSNYGIKQECCLNQIPYYHCVGGSVFDAFHDLLEGVVPAVLKMVLRNIIYVRKALSVADFNMRVASFNYGIPDNKNKPSPNFHRGMLAGRDKIKQTGAQVWCLMRAFPFLVADCVPEGDEHMEMIFLTQDIMKIVFSFETTNHDLDQLDTLVFTLIRTFKSLCVDAPVPQQNSEEGEQNNVDEDNVDEGNADEEFIDDPVAGVGPDENQEQPRRARIKHLIVHLFNKLHHLKHYSEQMRQKGPIVRLWCAKFEGSLKVFRQYAAICCNFKNPPKTMAQMFQLSHLWSVLKSHEEADAIEYKSGSQRTAKDTDHPDLFHEAGITDFVETNKAIVNGEEYRPGLFVVFKEPQKEPQFLLITELYVVRETTVFFLLKPWKVVQLSNKYNAYEVVPDANSKFSLKSVYSLSNFRPLAPWNTTGGDIYVSPRTQVL